MFALRIPCRTSLSRTVESTVPSTAIFESITDEYTAVSSSRTDTPLNAIDTLAALIKNRQFAKADALRKEVSTIPRHPRYLRPALHAITRPSHDRLDTFSAWLALTPDRHEAWQSFHDLRQRLFYGMDHLNLALVYRFGLVLAGKGYSTGDVARQVVSTLARYARPSVVARYLRQVEEASKAYHARVGTIPPKDELADAYSLAVRTVVLGGKGEAALGLISAAHARGRRVSDFTLNLVTKHVPTLIDRVQVIYPSWTPHPTSIATVKPEMIPTDHTTDIAALATRLRALRVALKSPCLPTPHALHGFITSYQSLGRTRAVTLLRTLAYRYSPKSAATWAFTAMRHHRARREYHALLAVFASHFFLVGVPRKTLLAHARGQSSPWTTRSGALRARLWPSAYHTALVWEALVRLSPRSDYERLYALLLSLVQRSRAPHDISDGDADAVRVDMPPDAFDAAHFSPFVMGWVRRPARAAGVLQDMVRLGVPPTVVQWSIVARGYAQHGDPGVALRILDRLADDPCVDAEDLRAVHTNVLRGLVCAGDVDGAREVERRLVDRLGYRPGERPATDASVALLRRLEGTLT